MNAEQIKTENDKLYIDTYGVVISEYERELNEQMSK